MASSLSLPCKSTSGIFSPVFALFFLLCFSACNKDEPDLVSPTQINRWQYISEKHGLPSNYVTTIFEDSEGRLWIGTDRGLALVSENKVTSYSAVDGLLDSNIEAIAEDNEGRIWVGTRRGANVLVDGRWLFYSYLYNAPVFALLNMKNDGGMLIGTGGYGIFRLDYGSQTFDSFSYIEECEDCNHINALFQSNDESVWVATFNGARKIRGSFVTQFDLADGLSGNVATTITEDSWGNIWIGTFEGKTISKINGNTVTQVTFNNGAERNFIFGIQEDNDGMLWVGTVGNGLFHYDGALMKQVSQGPPDTSITAMLKDRLGNLWIGTVEAGVAVYITNPR